MFIYYIGDVTIKTINGGEGGYEITVEVHKKTEKLGFRGSDMRFITIVHEPNFIEKLFGVTLDSKIARAYKQTKKEANQYIDRGKKIQEIESKFYKEVQNENN